MTVQYRVLANSLPRGGPFLLASALALLGYRRFAGTCVNDSLWHHQFYDVPKIERQPQGAGSDDFHRLDFCRDCGHHNQFVRQRQHKNVRLHQHHPVVGGYRGHHPGFCVVALGVNWKFEGGDWRLDLSNI